jgi:hypothetical protein
MFSSVKTEIIFLYKHEQYFELVDIERGPRVPCSYIISNIVNQIIIFLNPKGIKNMVHSWILKKRESKI